MSPCQGEGRGFDSRLALSKKEKKPDLQASFLSYDLLANWDLLEKGEKTFTIEPLKIGGICYSLNY